MGSEYGYGELPDWVRDDVSLDTRYRVAHLSHSPWPAWGTKEDG